VLPRVIIRGSYAGITLCSRCNTSEALTWLQFFVAGAVIFTEDAKRITNLVGTVMSTVGRRFFDSRCGALLMFISFGQSSRHFVRAGLLSLWRRGARATVSSLYGCVIALLLVRCSIVLSCATCCATRSTRSYMFFLTLCEDRSGSPKRPLHRDLEDILPDAVGGSYPQIP
jgi:uncharacterized membrane protein